MSAEEFHPRDFRRGLRHAGVTDAEYRVAVELSEYAAIGKAVVWPSLPTLAEHCRMERRRCAAHPPQAGGKGCHRLRYPQQGRPQPNQSLAAMHAHTGNRDPRVAVYGRKPRPKEPKTATGGSPEVVKEVVKEEDARARATHPATSSFAEEEPPRYCSAHMPNGTALNCRACGTARAEHFAWTQQRERERDEAIRLCRCGCDSRGYIGLRAGPFIRCPHSQERIEELERRYSEGVA